MLTNCFRFAPRDSVPGLIAKICKYLKEHPGWSEEELEEYIKQFIGQTGVESFNGRTGSVVLNDDDVNNLKIASAYFAEGDETIDDLNLKDLYNNGVRFVFTNWNSITSAYDLAFVLEYFGGSDKVVYYTMTTGSGGGSVISVNGKTGIVDLHLSDILNGSGAQVKLCTATEFTSTNLNTWNRYYEEGYRIVGVVNSDASAIDYIYLLKQDENNHKPIGISVGASDAYTPSNPPPYPVISVNNRSGEVKDLANATHLFPENPKEDRMDIYDSDSGIILKVHRTGRVRVGDGSKIAADLYSNAFIPPYPVTSVNGETGAVTGLYSAENPPPYPVTSVNGGTGDRWIRSLYKSPNVVCFNVYTGTNPYFTLHRDDGSAFKGISINDNEMRVNSYNESGDWASSYRVYSELTPPPYPVTNVLSRTGSIYFGQTFFTIDEAETNKNIHFEPFHSLIVNSDAGTLPSGNSMKYYLIFNEKTQPNLGGFIVSSLNTSLVVSIDWVGVDSQGRGYLSINFKANSEVALTNYHTIIYNLSGQTFTLFDMLRYRP